MKAKIYIFECLTNLHVGNGEANFNIIDNEVERDVVTGFPTINSSGVKGALRVFFEQNKVNQELINQIFGKEEGDSTPGQLKFLSADIFAQPVAGKDGSVYKRVAPVLAVKQLNEATGIYTGKPSAFSTKEDAAIKIANKDVTVISNDDFQAIDLPVLARNALDNGVSKNLWYEEVVPHKSLFTFTVVSTHDDEKLLKQFDDVINGKVVQFGGNASIGYGLCKILESL